jgi:hypothetical protein
MEEEFGKEETDDNFDGCEHCGEEWDQCPECGGCIDCGDCFCDEGDSEAE